MKLYDYAASANCYKVRLLLAQLGLPYERVPVDIFAGETLTPEFLALNPARETPVLELSPGRTLPESNAILLFLAEGTPLLPAALDRRAQVWRWLFFEQTQVMSTIGGVRFRRLTGRDAGREDELQRRTDSAHEALAVLDRELASRPFLAGADYSVADISVYGYAHVASEAGIELDAHPALRAWLERVATQPGYMNDLAPYPPNARAGASRSIYD